MSTFVNQGEEWDPNHGGQQPASGGEHNPPPAL